MSAMASERFVKGGRVVKFWAGGQILNGGGG